MAEDSSFYTMTMAKVYEDQGNNKEALRILQHMLSKEPAREDLKEALDRLTTKMAVSSKKQMTRIFEEWVDLLLTHQRIQKLKQMTG
jgi:hypothetical protein